MRHRAALAVLLAGLAGTAWAGEAVGPRLGAASNFGQTWDPAMLDAAEALGVTDLRDAVYWRHGETDDAYRLGKYDFLTLYPKLLPARGMHLTAILNEGHPDHDGGVTPHSPGAVDAFGAFGAYLAGTLAAIDTIEVGNEMNSATFTSGPMRAADLAGKAAFHTALLAATRDAVKAVRPDVTILGGAAHSIPLAWFRALSEAGAPAIMDQAVIHPYTTPPEQLRRQIALLRAVPGFADMPLAATEFGDEAAASAPATLMKYYCQMALSGVVRADWYPLNPRGDGLTPLIGPDHAPTDTGRAFALIRARMEGRPVRDLSPDPFTYGCVFGQDSAVIWGAPRAVALAPGLRALSPSGAPVPAPTLSRETPLVILSDGPLIALGDSLSLGPQRVVADSHDQFAYPGAPGDPFTRFARSGAQIARFALREGQETGGVPWTPYLGIAEDGMLRMDASFLLPSGGGEAPAEIVHRYVADRAQGLQLAARLAPSAGSSDGVTAQITLNGAPLLTRVVTRDEVLRPAPFDMAPGDVLDIAIGPGASPEGDATLYRFTLSRKP